MIFRLLAAAAVLAGLFFWGYSVGSTSKQRAWDLATAAQVKNQLTLAEYTRSVESALQLKIQEAQNAREVESAKSRRLAASLRAERDGLRNELAAFASGPSDDSLAACRERTAAATRVLESALRTSEECAGNAETLATDVRSLRAAWPVIKEK